jgi:hypothetical protein
MAKDREQRFQSMEEFAQALHDPAGKAMPSGDNFHFKPLFEDEASQKIKLPEVMGKAAFNTLDTPGQAKEKDKKITTLSGAASEIAGRRKTGSIAAIAGGVVLVLGIVGFVAFRGAGTKPPAPAVVVKPPAPPKRVEIEVKVVSTPPGAMVLRADQAEGPRLTPAVFHLLKGDASFDVQVKLDGYKPETRTIVADSNKEIDVVLAKLAAPPPQPQQPATPPSKKKERKKSSEPTLPDDDMKTLAPVFN